MAVEPAEGVKLAHGRLQSTLPERAKTRRQTITPDGTPGLLCLSNPGRRQTVIFHIQGVFFDKQKKLEWSKSSLRPALPLRPPLLPLPRRPPHPPPPPLAGTSSSYSRSTPSSPCSWRRGRAWRKHPPRGPPPAAPSAPWRTRLLSRRRRLGTAHAPRGRSTRSWGSPKPPTKNKKKKRYKGTPLPVVHVTRPPVMKPATAAV
jgi:hypothetical protein